MHVCVVGDINADCLWHVGQFPVEGGDCHADSVVWASGGAGANMAIMLARLGEPVRLVGCVGSDPAADIALACARGVGVDLTLVHVLEGDTTGQCSVIVGPNASRTLISHRGANRALAPHHIPTDAIASCDLLIVSAYALLCSDGLDACRRAVGLAHASGTRVVIDLGLEPIRRRRDELIDLCEKCWLLSLTQEELAELIPSSSPTQTVDQLISHGAQHIVVKRGAQGCLAACETRRVEARPPTVTAIDSTGCGDAFSAAFAWSLAHDADLDVCVRIANAVGALTSTRIGAADAQPSVEGIAALVGDALPTSPLPRLA